MEKTGEFLEVLIISEITGTISEQEKDLLHRILMINPEARKLYDEMYAYLTSPEVVNSIHELPQTIGLQDITNQTPHIKRKTPQKVISIVGISLLFFCTYLFFHCYYGSSSNKNFIGLKLILDNGKTIPLSNNDTVIHNGMAVFTSRRDTLYYSNGLSGYGKISVPAGRLYNVHLSDGSIISLNSLSESQFPFSFSNKKKEITVNGEAYIHVAPGGGRPFIVHLPQSTVQVLGTTFNVNTYNGADIVSLVNGKVRIYNSKDSLLLSPGKEGVIQKGKEIAVREFDPDLIASWKDSIIYYEDKSTQEIAGILNRMYNLQVQVAPAAINRKFFGAFNRRLPIIETLETLKATKQLDYTYNGQTVYLF